MKRRPVVAVIGNGQATAAACAVAEELGRLLVERGFRVVTGGLGGVMEAASRGAQQAANKHDGDVIGILPGTDATSANPYVDIVIPTGMGLARNVLVVQTAAAVVAVGGGAGTLSEMAHAWQSDRLLVAIALDGVSGQFAGSSLDARDRPPILRANSAREAVDSVANGLAHAGDDPQPG